jgi:hypothetical protein
MPENEHREMTDPVYAPPKPIHVVRNGVNVAARQVLALTGFGLIVLAIPIGIATPMLPVGLMMAVVGTVLLGTNGVWGQQWLDGMLKRHPKLEKALPGWLVQLSLGRRKRSPAD